MKWTFCLFVGRFPRCAKVGIIETRGKKKKKKKRKRSRENVLSPMIVDTGENMWRKNFFLCNHAKREVFDKRHIRIEISLKLRICSKDISDVDDWKLYWPLHLDVWLSLHWFIVEKVMKELSMKIFTRSILFRNRISNIISSDFYFFQCQSFDLYSWNFTECSFNNWIQ